MLFSTTDDSSSLQEDNSKTPLTNLNDEIKAGDSKIKVFSFEPSSVDQQDVEKCVQFWQQVESSGLKPMRGSNMSSDPPSIIRNCITDSPKVVTWGDALEMLRHYGLDQLALPAKNKSTDCKMCKLEADHDDHFQEDYFDLTELNSYDPQRIISCTIGMMTDEIVMADKAVMTDFKTPAQIETELIATKEVEIDDLFMQLSAYYSSGKPCEISQHECVCIDCVDIAPYRLQRNAMLGPPAGVDTAVCSCGEANCMCSHVEAVLKAIEETNYVYKQATSCDCLECYEMLLKMQFDMKMVLEDKIGTLQVPVRRECSCDNTNCPCALIKKLHMDIDKIMGDKKNICTCGQAKCVCIPVVPQKQLEEPVDGKCNCLECYKDLLRAWFDLKIVLEDKLGATVISGIPNKRNCSCHLENCACGILNNIYNEMDKIMQSPSKAVCSCEQPNCDCKFSKFQIPGCTCLDCYKELLKAMFDLKIVLVDKVGAVLGVPKHAKCSCREPGCPCSVLDSLQREVNEIMESEKLNCSCGKASCNCKLDVQTKITEKTSHKVVDECNCLDCYKELLRAWFDLRMILDDNMTTGVVSPPEKCKCTCTQMYCPCTTLNNIHGEIDKILQGPALITCTCGKANCKCLFKKTDESVKCNCVDCGCLDCYSQLLNTWLEYQMILQNTDGEKKPRLTAPVMCECSCCEMNCPCSILKDLYSDVTRKPFDICGCGSKKHDSLHATCNETKLDTKQIKSDVNETNLDINQTKLETKQTKLDPQQTKLDPKQTKLDVNQTNLDINQTKLDAKQTNLDINQTKLDQKQLDICDMEGCIYNQKSSTQKCPPVKPTTTNKRNIKNLQTIHSKSSFQKITPTKPVEIKPEDTSVVSGKQFRNYSMPINNKLEKSKTVRKSDNNCKCKVARRITKHSNKKTQVQLVTCSDCACDTQSANDTVKIDDEPSCGLKCTCGCLDEPPSDGIERYVEPPIIKGADSHIKVLLKRGCTKPKSC